MVAIATAIYLAFAPVSEVAPADGLPLIEFPQKPETPDLKLRRLNGDNFDIRSVRGRIVVVNFWATWCAPCLKEMPVFEEAWASLQKDNILLVAVNLGDTVDKIQRFLKHRPVTFPILLDVDSDTFEPWQIQSLPTTYVVGRDGRIHYGAIGTGNGLPRPYWTPSEACGSPPPLP